MGLGPLYNRLSCIACHVKNGRGAAPDSENGVARTLVEAILWHGGEAQSSADAFRNLPELQRDALLAFLNSL
ncbi:MAG: hypothetical protein HZC06_13015 [Methylocystis sp.]|nr:hypothetical protein [Methylocystis sp.]